MGIKGNQIVFLDAGTVDYGDVSLEAIQKLGPFRAYRATPPREIEKRVGGASIVITNKCVFDARLLSRLKALRLIAIAATGTNNVDLERARRQGIRVTNVSGYSTETVVQCTFAFILALAGNLVKFNQAAHTRWPASDFFTFPAFPLQEVHGKTLGIVGHGRIGKKVAKVARAFGMKVLVAGLPGRRYAEARRDSGWLSREPGLRGQAQAAGKKLRRANLESLFRRSNFVTLHAALTPVTRNLMNARNLGRMKRGSFLINMARGGLVDENALARALKSGRLAGAAADVLNQEPPPRNHVLLKAPNFSLTPHIAWASREARIRLIREVALNVQAFLEGRRRNRVV